MGELEAIGMQPQETWRLFKIWDRYTLIAHLDMLFPPDAVLYLEGDHFIDDIRDFALARSPEKVAVVAKGSIGPGITFSILPPRIIELTHAINLHILLTPENLKELWRLMENHAEPEIADHVHVYRDDTVLMEWHDWPSSDVYLTGDIPEETVRVFCETVGCRCERSFDYGPREDRFR